MEIEEMLRKQPGLHIGYQLELISTSRLTEADMSYYTRLKTIPNKITAFLERSKISTVWKSECFGGSVDYYVILATDGTMFHVDF